MQNIVMIRVDQLHPHPANPRKDLGDLTELADSIKAKGVLQNLTVVPYWSSAHKRIMEGMYTIIIGHRRHAAAQKAGLKELPCVITEMTDEEQIDTMAVENLQRSDLTAYEQAEHFQLMLDMGRTVQQVSEKTGFSETTIRSRVKMTKLDKAKFKNANAKGGTMSDYLKVASIENEDRRNKVLEAIGTSEFNAQYQAALRAEENEKYLRDTIEAFRNADWCEEITAEQRDELNRRFISIKHSYGTWNKRPVEKPEDAGQGKHLYLYFFVVSNNQVDLYREVKVQERTEQQAPEISPEEQERQECADKVTALLNECQDQEDDFRAIRENFITEFSAFATYREEIMAFHMKAWMFVDGLGRCSENLDQERLAEMLNIGYDEDKGKLDKYALDHQLRVQPEKVLLYAAYILLEDGSRKWLTTLYDNTVKCSLPKHRPDEQLDLLYECLRTLGYAWSTGEQRASVGDRPQFQQAERLVKEYNEEVGNG